MSNPNVMGLWMSPEIPDGGLTGSDNDTWQKVWSVSEYEPDAIVRRTYGGGALASYNGTLYWGSMHVPFIRNPGCNHGLSKQPIINLGGYDNSFGADDIVATALGAHRAISIFSGRNFGIRRGRQSSCCTVINICRGMNPQPAAIRSPKTLSTRT